MTLLEKQVHGLTDDLSQVASKLASEVTPKSVHRLRTTIRRIETAVSFVNPDLGKKLERSLERLDDLRRRAGRVRDIDVQLQLLSEIGNGSTARDRKTLTDLLEKKSARHARRLVSTLARQANAKFFARMERIAEKIGAGPAEYNRPLAPLEEARLQLSKLAAAFTPQQALKPNRLHEARIHLKKIRYLGELADDSPERAAFLDEIRSVQTAVGDWHDWEELARLAEKRFADRVNSHLLREVRALFASKESEAVSAVTSLFAKSAVSARKPPRAVQPLRTFARHA